MNLVQLAGALPKNPVFREWCGHVSGFDAFSEEHAAQFIRAMCGITSRRELATSEIAESMFHNLIRRPFVEFCEQSKEPA